MARNQGRQILFPIGVGTALLVLLMVRLVCFGMIRNLDVQIEAQKQRSSAVQVASNSELSIEEERLPDSNRPRGTAVGNLPLQRETVYQFDQTIKWWPLGLFAVFLYACWWARTPRST